MKDKVQQAVGGAREKLGDVTGNDRLKASGRSQRRTAQVREVAHDLRDKA
ncbi:CsbD family protein [Amycolatopsis sp. NBC_01286]|nr:CsbD family protein [Amycolatopsis sp. NBC_01286]